MSTYARFEVCASSSLLLRSSRTLARLVCCAGLREALRLPSAYDCVRRVNGAVFLREDVEVDPEDL